MGAPRQPREGAKGEAAKAQLGVPRADTQLSFSTSWIMLCDAFKPCSLPDERRLEPVPVILTPYTHTHTHTHSHTFRQRTTPVVTTGKCLSN